MKKILIANRGEIALRVIRACKELNIKTVSVYSTADAASLHRTFADESVCIGEAVAFESYLNIPHIIAATEISQADAVHPGYGFLSENAQFANVCKENNLTFIGPSKEIIANMGDKSTARETMKKANVPVIPGTSLLNDLEEALEEAKKIKYPIILKATAGGGGKGMRICQNAKELSNNFEITRNEALASFGNPNIYMEKYIENPHHIEVQVLADKYGNCVHLGERDCSVQRRHQKLIEETPSCFISEEVRKNICEVAVEATKSINYIGAGTIEFLVDDNMDFYFMEMNTRIQVEHTISELYTGIDIVKEQIRVAMGEKLTYDQENITFRGHVIECRINAEDPFNNFAPSPGTIGRYHIPQGLGVRVDSHVYSGYTIPTNYDSMIGKLIVWGLNREEALKRMERSLVEMIIENIKTTIPLHSQIIKNKEFIKGKYSTKFIEKFKLQPISKNNICYLRRNEK